MGQVCFLFGLKNYGGDPIVIWNPPTDQLKLVFKMGKGFLENEKFYFCFTLDIFSLYLCYWLFISHKKINFSLTSQAFLKKSIMKWCEFFSSLSIWYKIKIKTIKFIIHKNRSFKTSSSFSYLLSDVFLFSFFCFYFHQFHSVSSIFSGLKLIAFIYEWIYWKNSNQCQSFCMYGQIHINSTFSQFCSIF